METDADPKPNVRWSLANRAEEREEEEPDVSIISQENSGKQLTWTHRNSQNLNQQPGPT